MNPSASAGAENDVQIELRDVTMAYGSYVVLRHVNARVRRGEVFIIMGVSGGGKTTLLKAMIGLKAPQHGQILYGTESFWEVDPAGQRAIQRRFGVLFQGGALWSSMTLAENVALPLEEYTELGRTEINEIVQLKLALVGLAGYGEFYPAELSGGMRQRAGLARAMALDPEILFFDEPSTSLDPISSRRLDDLILELRDSLGATVVVVTHELPSIFAIGDHAILVDASIRAVRAEGHPRDLLARTDDRYLTEFLTRGGPGRVPPGNGRAT